MKRKVFTGIHKDVRKFIVTKCLSKQDVDLLFVAHHSTKALKRIEKSRDFCQDGCPKK